jgi:hypothetical protein
MNKHPLLSWVLGCPHLICLFFPQLHFTTNQDCIVTWPVDKCVKYRPLWIHVNVSVHSICNRLNVPGQDIYASPPMIKWHQWPLSKKCVRFYVVNSKLQVRDWYSDMLANSGHYCACWMQILFSSTTCDLYEPMDIRLPTPLCSHILFDFFPALCKLNIHVHIVNCINWIKETFLHWWDQFLKLCTTFNTSAHII